MEEALRAESVEKRYGETVALDGVSFSVAQGEVFALVGPNGAGKTTLVRALTGTTEPTAGSTEILGESPTEVDRGRIGLLPQSFDPPGRLTARELVRYYAGLYDGARPVEDALTTVGMAERADTWYERLSGGQRRRVCVATALVNDPEVLVLDEPTTGIDPAGRRTLWTVLEDFADAGTTVLLTTHDMREAERLADRVGVLADGRLVEVGSPAALVREHGGDPRLIVEADGGDDVLADRGYRISARGGALVVHDVGTAELGDVVAALDEAGVAYDALTWRQPTLEDVYLNLADTESAREAPVRAGGAS